MFGVLVDTFKSTVNFIDGFISVPKSKQEETLSDKVDKVSSSTMQEIIKAGISYGACTLYSEKTKDIVCSVTQTLVPALSKLNEVSTYINFPTSFYYCSNALPYAAQGLRYIQFVKVAFLFGRTALNTHENSGEIIKDVVRTASHCFQLYQVEQLLLK